MISTAQTPGDGVHRRSDITNPTEINTRLHSPSKRKPFSAHLQYSARSTKIILSKPQQVISNALLKNINVGLTELLAD